MKLTELVTWASNKEQFTNLDNYIEFCRAFLDYIRTNIQADIVSKNETHYHFLQYKEEGFYNVTRPLNYNLMYSVKERSVFTQAFKNVLENIRLKKTNTPANREIVNRSIYTIQQSIGATLDALPAGMSNKARKVNGDLFERFIRFILTFVGIDCTSGVVHVPIVVDGCEEFSMSYQHDLVIRSGKVVKIIGSVKTSSKDRLDKIFIDKFLFSKLTGTSIPHIAIFLNDVQRKGRSPKSYGISATFLPGHFKGYTVKLNPLDGVYYFDIRPNMLTEPILKEHIKTFDYFLFGDLWNLMSKKAIVAKIEPENTNNDES
ncbi:hypothetical protein KAU45_09440 [bacterium]|nr:hypothetical protein [bacterium]